MHKRMTLNGLALIGMLAGASAMAETQPGFYAGAGVGQASIEVDNAGFDANDTAFKVFGGYNFNQNFAVELTYLDAGKPDKRIGLTHVEGSLDGFNVSGIARLPFTDVFSGFVKLGFASYDGELKARVGNRTVGNIDVGDEDLSYGIGAAFNIGSAFEVRAEYEGIDISAGSFNVLSVRGLYKF